MSATKRRVEITTQSQTPEILTQQKEQKTIQSKSVYKETDYDKLLRSFTIKDTLRTLVITLVLFGIQVGIYYSYQAGLLSNILP